MENEVQSPELESQSLEPRAWNPEPRTQSAKPEAWRQELRVWSPKLETRNPATWNPESGARGLEEPGARTSLSGSHALAVEGLEQTGEVCCCCSRTLQQLRSQKLSTPLYYCVPTKARSFVCN